MKAAILLPEVGFVENADIREDSKLAVHPSPLGKGYCVSCLSTGKLVLWTRLKGEAVKARKEIDARGGPTEELLSELEDRFPAKKGQD